MNRSNIRGLEANGKTSGEPDPSRLAFSMREVGAALGVSERSIWTLINSGKLPSFKIGRSVRVRREDLENFMRNGGTSD
jgi:excisionase family DNA binding protein